MVRTQVAEKSSDTSSSAWLSLLEDSDTSGDDYQDEQEERRAKHRSRKSSSRSSGPSYDPDSERSSGRSSTSHSRYSSSRQSASTRSSIPVVSKQSSDGLDENSEQKKVRWERPTMHRYKEGSKVADQHRVLEQNFFNVLDTMQANIFCAQQEPSKPFLGTKNVWSSLFETTSSSQQLPTSTHGSSSHGQLGTSTSQSQSTEDSVDESRFTDGPEFIEIVAQPPTLSESITVSESMFSGSSFEYDDETTTTEEGYNKMIVRRNRSSTKYRDFLKGELYNAAASGILDDLSCLETGIKTTYQQQDAPQQDTAKINPDSNSAEHPGEIKAKKHSRSSLVRRKSDMIKKKYNAFKTKIKDSSNNPPISDINVGHSHEMSTVSGTDASRKARNLENHSSRDATLHEMSAAVLTEKECVVEATPKSAHYDSAEEEEDRSCVPSRLQRSLRMKKYQKSSDGVTASMSSMSSGMKFSKNRSGEGNNVSEKENQTISPYTYEYNSGVNTYVAYFETSTSTETRSALQLIEHPNPPLLPFDSNEVVVKIEASTISASDCIIRRGDWWSGTLSLPRIPGVAFAGKIDQIHRTGKNGLQVGDQVLSLVCSGGNSRYVCIPRDRLVKVPDGYLDSGVLACLPEIYLSAFQVLHFGQRSPARHRTNALVGKTIMFLGGASAIGQAIIELGMEAGASSVYVTASKAKHFQRIIDIGGIPLGDDPNEWAATMSQKIDILIATPPDTFRVPESGLTYDHLNVLKKKGQLMLLGGPGSPDDFPRIHPGRFPCHVDVFKLLKRAQRLNVFESWERDMKQSKRDLRHLVGLLQKGVVKPKVLERVPLSKVAKAEDIVEKRQLNGAIICEPWIKEKGD